MLWDDDALYIAAALEEPRAFANQTLHDRYISYVTYTYRHIHILHSRDRTAHIQISHSRVQCIQLYWQYLVQLNAPSKVGNSDCKLYSWRAQHMCDSSRGKDQAARSISGRAAAARKCPRLLLSCSCPVFTGQAVFHVVADTVTCACTCCSFCAAVSSSRTMISRFVLLRVYVTCYHTPEEVCCCSKLCSSVFLCALAKPHVYTLCACCVWEAQSAFT
jgi:hypothetical protein